MRLREIFAKRGAPGLAEALDEAFAALGKRDPELAKEFDAIAGEFLEGVPRDANIGSDIRQPESTGSLAAS